MPQTSSLLASISGYAAIYNVPDQSGDIMAPSAFQHHPMPRPASVRMLYQHKVECPIGCWTHFRSTEKGLFVHGVLLLNSNKARDIHALLEGGAINGLSVGFRTIQAQRGPIGSSHRSPDQPTSRSTSGLSQGRHITAAELWEISIVTFPMASGARITQVSAPYFAPDKATARPAARQNQQQTTKNPERAGLRTQTARRASYIPSDARHRAPSLKAAAAQLLSALPSNPYSLRSHS